MSEVAPVGEPNRIQSLDVTRGFAVLGILIVNAAYFAAPWQTALNPTLAPLDVNQQTLWSWSIMHVVFEFKCITLFSLLFGASIYLVGGPPDDKLRSAILRRRLFWLLVFGALHAMLLWYGDVLVTYALTGYLVSLIRGWRARHLLMGGVALLFVSFCILMAISSLFATVSPAKLTELRDIYWAPPAEEMQRQIAAYQSGIQGAMRENFATWKQFLFGGLAALMLRTAGVMMIGMALMRLSFLSGNAPRWSYYLALGLGAAAFLLIGLQAQANVAANFDFRYMQVAGSWPNTTLAIFCAIGFAALFALLTKANIRLVTEPLANVGRMAFTNYITQSLIMTTIFWGGRGFGLYGEVDRPTLMGIVVAIWVLQLLLSWLWLKRFEMGPLEWVWRWLSYGQKPAFKRAAPAPA